jgi:Ca2+-transporting ATPase
VVVNTGMNTEVGRIAGLLEAAEKEPTPLQQELDRTGKRLTVVMLGICAVVFAAGLFSTSTLTLNVVLSLFLFAVALAVAAIPEALPAIVTVGLSLGVRRMAAAHAIVRKLPAIETLGAATVICSDKTGTLTRNEMTVRAIVTGDALIEVSGSGYIPEGEFSKDGKPIVEASPLRNGLERRCMPPRSSTIRSSLTATSAGGFRAIRPRVRWLWRRVSSA